MVEYLALAGGHESFHDIERELAAVVAFLQRADAVRPTAPQAAEFPVAI